MQRGHQRQYHFWSEQSAFYPITVGVEYPHGADATMIEFCRRQNRREEDAQKFAIVWIGDVPWFNVCFRSEDEIEPFMARMQLETGYRVQRPPAFLHPLADGTS
jgi:hypothetical protein